jgi:DNA replication protein DnaC
VTLSTIYDQLSTLGLSGFSASLEKQSENPSYTKLSFEERLYHLLESEMNERSNRKIKRLLSGAHLKEREASIEEVEYSAKRGLARSVILSLATCDYLKKHQNILITGATGVGKSFLAQALAKQAILEGYSARYYRVSKMLEEIKVARLDGTYTKTLNKIARYDLLLLDDFGISPLQPDELNDLFEVIEERTLAGSTIVTAQLPVKDWHGYLKNETLADAMMDRLIHSSHKIELKGESMRKMLAEG